MTDTRKCIFMKGSNTGVVGTFHRWGDFFYTDEGNNPHPLTVAIIEDAEGRVHQVQPQDVRFTDAGTSLETWEKLAR